MRIDGAGEIEKISKSLHDSLSRGMSFDAINSHKRSLQYVAKKIYIYIKYNHPTKAKTCRSFSYSFEHGIDYCLVVVVVDIDDDDIIIMISLN